MKTLLLTCGLSFSGKSTLAREIVRKLGCSRITLDEINHERGAGFGGDGISVEEWERTHAVAIARLEKFMQSGRDIILDDTNCLRWIRHRFRSVATQNGYSTVVIFLDVTLSILKERRLKNDCMGERRAVKDAIFEQLNAQFEAPDSDEATLVFTPKDKAEEWIRVHLG
jgi:predicted kinase